MEDDTLLRTFRENIESLVSPYDATPKSQINGWCIPQKKYEKGAGRGLPTNQNLVPFIREDGTYIPVSAALVGDHSGLIARHDLPGFGEAGSMTTLRFEWPGYPPYDFKLRTHDWRTSPTRITRAALATEVAKIVKQLVEKMQTQNIDPEYQQWRVGLNGIIQWKDLRLAALEQVSAGSYQPRLFWKP